MLGIVFIVGGAGGLTLLGLYALIPGLIPTHGWGRSRRLRIEEKRLLALADLTPPAVAEAAAVALGGHLNPRLADDLFAELFALRTEVAGMTNELRAIRQQLEAAGAFEEPDLALGLSAA